MSAIRAERKSHELDIDHAEAVQLPEISGFHDFFLFRR